MSHDLRFARAIDAPPEAVFTRQGGQEAFYSEPGWIVESECDLRVGGVWAVRRRTPTSSCSAGSRMRPCARDRLFGETQDKIPLRLVESRPFGEGVVNMIYAPATANG